LYLQLGAAIDRQQLALGERVYGSAVHCSAESVEFLIAAEGTASPHFTPPSPGLSVIPVTVVGGEVKRACGRMATHRNGWAYGLGAFGQLVAYRDVPRLVSYGDRSRVDGPLGNYGNGVGHLTRLT